MKHIGNLLRQFAVMYILGRIEIPFDFVRRLDVPDFDNDLSGSFFFCARHREAEEICTTGRRYRFGTRFRRFIFNRGPHQRFSDKGKHLLSTISIWMRH